MLYQLSYLPRPGRPEREDTRRTGRRPLDQDPSAIAAVAHAWPRIDRQGDLLHLVEAEGVDGLELAALHDVRGHAPTELVAVDEQLGLRPPAVEVSVLAPGAQALPVEGVYRTRRI